MTTKTKSPRAQTLDLVMQIKDADQDFEWYPTTREMILAVMRWLPENAGSIMDIGAGDGRVLKAFAEKCKTANLYSIEKSPILAQAQPEDIIPIGTELFEQNLSALPMDYIFCNPMYSQFEEWACKVIAEGYAKKAFLVIPQRWTESKVIAKSLKDRGATSRVLMSGDFTGADRAARAKIDIVEVTFPLDRWDRNPQDPFDIWFDNNVGTFDQAEPVKETYQEREDLARRLSDASIDDMVRAYRVEYERMEQNYRDIFKLDYAILQELGVNKDHVREGLKKKMEGLKTKYWQILFDRLDAITSRLSTKSKERLLSKLTANAKIEFTTSNAYTVVLWAIKNANQYFDEQLVDLFHELSLFENVLNYKSNVRAWIKDGWRYGNKERNNTHYTLDYRIVVSRYNAINKDRWDSYNNPGNLHRDCHNLIADIIAVMGNLGFSTGGRSLNRQWHGGQWQDFYETNSDEVLFQVKAYMNGNLHMRFKPEAIMALNINAGRLLNWVRSEEDVVNEMGYTPKQAKQYFKSNIHILTSNVPLLGGG